MKKTYLILLVWLVFSPAIAQAEAAQSAKIAMGKKVSGTLTIRTVGPNGGPLLDDPWRLKIHDLNYNPVAVLGERPSQTFTSLPNKPLLFSACFEVPGFGKLSFTAANDGTGFLPKGQTLDVAYEVARHRYLRATAVLNEAKTQGFHFSNKTSLLTKAKKFLDQAKNSAPGTAEQTKYALESLRYSCPASEAIVCELARQKLDRQGGLRTDQWVTTFAVYESEGGQQWRDAMAPLFNAAVTFWDWRGQWLSEGKWQLDFMDQQGTVKRLTEMGKKQRGHALVWIKKVPDGFEPVSLDHLVKSHVEFTHSLVSAYPQITSWVLANECNYYYTLDMLQPEDFARLIRAVSMEVKRCNPQAIRGVVSTGLWSEDEAHRVNNDSPAIVGQYQFHQMLIAAKVPYEYIGMQLYFTGRDLFEVHELLEIYSKLGKRIRVCEMQASSRDEPHPTNHHFPKGSAGQTYHWWHRDWDETLQADWLEGMFLVCLSKDYVDEWPWWDIADYSDHYVPWGGLADENYQPKESYKRLEQLIKQWGKN